MTALQLLPSLLLPAPAWVQQPAAHARPRSHHICASCKSRAAGNLIQLNLHSNSIFVPRSRRAGSIYGTAAASTPCTRLPALLPGLTPAQGLPGHALTDPSSAGPEPVALPCPQCTKSLPASKVFCVRKCYADQKLLLATESKDPLQLMRSSARGTHTVFLQAAAAAGSLLLHKKRASTNVPS